MRSSFLSRWLPKRPSYDPLEAESLSLPEKWKLGAREWALHGYGAPSVLIAFHVIKIIFYVGVWVAVCAWHNTDDRGLVDALTDWQAFQRFATTVL